MLVGYTQPVDRFIRFIYELSYGFALKLCIAGHIGERYFVNFLFAKETDKGIALENKSGD